MNEDLENQFAQIEEDDPRLNRFGEFMIDDTKYNQALGRTSVRLLTIDEQRNYERSLPLPYNDELTLPNDS